MTNNSYQIKKIFKVLLLTFAFLIGFFSLWYTNGLVNKLELRERTKIATWADATRLIASPKFEGDVNFLFKIIEANTTIPVILTDENGIVKGSRNLDSTGYNGNNFMRDKIKTMELENDPIEVEYIAGQNIKIFYENSELLNQLRIYPYFQLGIIALFLTISYFAFSYSRRSEQNKVWAGMSKETAHQLGTPISSLIGWVDYLKEGEYSVPPKILDEINHDLERLNLITERFSKIGSKPSLSIYNLHEVLSESILYINSRTSDKVLIEIKDWDKLSGINVSVNKPLFAWVIENLCKNAVDAMNGEGKIWFEVFLDDSNYIFIDIHDTGKGIPINKQKTIFKPGYTTKKRGWGLGLSLVKRIIENYHQGKIYVKSSEIRKGSHFRIELLKT
ncbi:MAG: HAMP domain-containing sensor histidine kinase [Bacteroidia bacterium]|nr:HAMP domain-containing sensor histidine kinase [Bacteroidia bacterium]MDG2041374.1 HAMP domain-containing sensor histidine kinase [Bacteroidia bacterium]